MQEMMYGLENNPNLGYEQGNYLTSYLAGSSKSDTHISCDYGQDTPEHYDLLDNLTSQTSICWFNPHSKPWMLPDWPIWRL